ncbi:hypothetical protein [Streptomyces sp. NPDC006134]|uniref:hypothetical protein n=1 Tax=Streptomyces sp. NPDC006134 TaxID=3154467 RepID=UPI0034033CF8
MSTDARRASFPPRPATPPRPGTPERPPQPAATGRPAPAPADAPGTRLPHPGPMPPPQAPAPQPAATGHPAPVPSGAVTPSRPGTPVPPPQAPAPVPSGTADTRVPAAGPTPPPPPPPPPASARFPDAPPAVGSRAPGGTPGPPVPGTAVPTRPDGRPQAPAPRPGASPETPSETTTELRPARPTDGTGEPRPRATTAPPHPAPRTGRPAERPSETTARLRPVPAGAALGGTGAPNGARGERGGPGDGHTPPPISTGAVPATPAPRPQSQPRNTPAPGVGRPLTPFGPPPEQYGAPQQYGAYDGQARPRRFGGRGRPQIVAATVCLVLGVGLVGGAVTGSWLTGDGGEDGARGAFAAAGDLWHSVPVDRLFPPTVQGRGAGPGGADRTWTRIAVAPDSGCADAFDPLLRKVLAPAGCARLLRATYTDATQSHVTTVGLLFTRADAATTASLARRFEKEGLARRSDLMPLPYAAKGTAAAGFGAGQRASWTVSVLTDAPVVVYAVSGWADGRTVDDPQPAEEAMESGATTAPAQAGLGHEARGLADRIERSLRKHAASATEQPS